jgi:hypothetical protein
MAREKPSVTEETPLPIPEAEPSVAPAEPGVEEAAPAGEGAAPPKAEEAKPDVRALLAKLPADERKALAKEELGEELSRLEQSAADRAWKKLQTEQQGRIQANQELQDTLRNLEMADDDNKRAGHIDAYAQRYSQRASQQAVLEVLDDIRDAFGVSPEEHDEIIFKLHQEASRDNRVARIKDYVTHVTGERFMPKKDYTKQMREEIKAELAELRGTAIENQPAPVTVGPGGTASNKDPEEDWMDAGSPYSGPIYDRYIQWREQQKIR